MWYEVGEGWVIVLIYGYFFDVKINWICYGYVVKIVVKGFCVIMLDLCVYGDSVKFYGLEVYFVDVLMWDGYVLIVYLGLMEYDLGGYLLGVWMILWMLVMGVSLRWVIFFGMGLEGLIMMLWCVGYFCNILINLGEYV